MRAPRILLVMIKNTSVLDTSVPLLWKIRQHCPGADISVLYCVPGRKKILRSSHFYSSLMATQGIREYDLLDFLKPEAAHLAPILRQAFVFNWWDSRPDDVPGLKLAAVAQHHCLRAEDHFASLIEPERIMTELDPDMILFDNRTLTSFPGREQLFAWLDAARRPVFLLPHGQHQGLPDDFIPFDRESGRDLADYCEYWMPFIHERAWERVPDRREQFVYTGYPGLDSEWLDWLQMGRPELGRPARGARRGPLKCLFIIRAFSGRLSNRPEDDDPYIFREEEFLSYCRLLDSSLKASGEDVQVVVKPHPANNFRTLATALQSIGIGDWEVSYEASYAHVADTDLVVSLYSTTMLIPALAGIPVVLLHTRVQDKIHEWDRLRQIYSNLSHYLPDPAGLPEALPEILARARGGVDAANDDVAHLRAFFPDGSLPRCLGRMGL